KAVYDPAALFREHVVWAEVSRIATRDQHSISHQVLRSAQQVCGGMVDVFAVLQADQVGSFRWIEWAAVEAGKHSAPKPGEIRGFEVGRRDRLDDIVGAQRSGPPPPANLSGRLAGRKEFQKSGRIVSDELRDHADRASRIGARAWSAIRDAAVGHDPAVANS